MTMWTIIFIVAVVFIPIFIGLLLDWGLEKETYKYDNEDNNC